MLRHSNYCEFGISDFGNKGLFLDFSQNISQKSKLHFRNPTADSQNIANASS